MDKYYRTALITGGDSGLGYSFAKILAKLGTGLILVSKNGNKLEQARQNLQALSKAAVITIEADLSNPESNFIIFEHLNELNIFPDLLINNAGAAYFGTFCSKDTNFDINIININMTSLTVLSKLFISKLQNDSDFSILNVASTLAFRASPGWAVYAATKAYLYSLSRSLANEFRGTKVAISVLCPGKIDTDFDINSGKPVNENDKKDSPDYIAEYAIRKLSNGKSVIIPGVKNKMKYLIYKYLPESVTNSILSRL
jgi:short-subunit dehydrogenase